MPTWCTTRTMSQHKQKTFNTAHIHIHFFFFFPWAEQHTLCKTKREYTPTLLPSIPRLTCRMLAFVGQMQVSKCWQILSWPRCSERTKKFVKMFMHIVAKYFNMSQNPYFLFRKNKGSATLMVQSFPAGDTNSSNSTATMNIARSYTPAATFLVTAST